MSEDRFGDLGGGSDRRSAAERFEEQDRINPEPDDPRRRPPEPPRRSSRWAWTVGFLAIMVVGIVVVTTSLPEGREGLGGPTVGSKLLDFAAPLATGAIDGDANVRQRTGGSDAAGKVPACETISEEEVLNVCELRRRPLVLTFLVTRGADCEPQVDRVERMRREFPEVEFAAVVSGNDREEVERIVRRRGWTLPVGVDPDGAVVNLYGIAVCPTTILASPGGRVRQLRLGNLTEDQLRADVRRLVRQSGG